MLQMGRTVTLVKGTPDDHVFGLAFKVPAEHVETTREYLDLREQAGYEASDCCRVGLDSVDVCS